MPRRSACQEQTGEEKHQQAARKSHDLNSRKRLNLRQSSIQMYSTNLFLRTPRLYSTVCGWQGMRSRWICAAAALLTLALPAMAAARPNASGKAAGKDQAA